MCLFILEKFGEIRKFLESSLLQRLLKLLFCFPEVGLHCIAFSTNKFLQFKY